MPLVNRNEKIAKIGMQAYTTAATSTRTFYQVGDAAANIGFPMQVDTGVYAKPFAGGTFIGVLVHTPDHVVDADKKVIKGDRSLMLMQTGNMFIEIKDFTFGDEIEGKQAYINAAGEFKVNGVTGDFKLNGTYGIDRESGEPLLFLTNINIEEVQ